MKQEHLQELINQIHDDYDGKDEAIDAARAELEAMRTPITPETLTAAGWKEIYQSSNTLMFKQSGRTIYAIAGRPRFEISFWQDGETEMYCGFGKNAGYTVPMPSNMHDLRELVRLLGGAK